LPNRSRTPLTALGVTTAPQRPPAQLRPQTQPDADFHEWKAIAIGARSQAAKTYLEKHFESFAALGTDELIQHGLSALTGSVADGELTAENTTVAIVGQGLDFTILEGDDLAPHIAKLKEGEVGSGGAAAGGSMETD